MISKKSLQKKPPSEAGLSRMNWQNLQLKPLPGPKETASCHWLLFRQQQAEEAIKMAVSISSPGYNVFIPTESPMLHLAALEHILREIKQTKRDIIYVQDFGSPCRPYSISLPAGSAPDFVETIRKLVDMADLFPESDKLEKKSDPGTHPVQGKTLKPEEKIARLDIEKKELRERWPEVRDFLDSLIHDISVQINERNHREAPSRDRYTVQILLSHPKSPVKPERNSAGMKLLYENSPDQTTLFGTVRTGEGGYSFMHRKGAFLDTEDGVLVIRAEEILAEKELWKNLKRSLRSQEIYPIDESSSSDWPERMRGIPIDTTVILLGTPPTFDRIFAEDNDFPELFKVMAEFTPSLKRDSHAEACYRDFIQSFVQKEKLLPLDEKAIIEIIFQGIHQSGKKNQLSTRFDLMGDLIQECHYWAKQKKADCISDLTVKTALKKRQEMTDLQQKILIEEVQDKNQLLDLEGKLTGVINGLALFDSGVQFLGTVIRITATVGPGKDGLINIEREAGLSGEIHDKGMFLLEGYLRHRFARRMPITVAASIAVEQSYNEIDGDSASAAELAALLSAIAEIPLRQDVAVTGAVDQHGSLLPVGGIVEKIEGFFRLCRQTGLSGKQGVIIPAPNQNQLILSEEVVKSVRQELFSLWPARNIDDILSVLSGIPAGTEKPGGRFAKKSFNENVRLGLLELSRLS